MSQYPLVSVILVLGTAVPLQLWAQQCKMTPEGFETTFLQQCQSVLGSGSDETCTDAWNNFMNAFAGVSPETVTPRQEENDTEL